MPRVMLGHVRRIPLFHLPLSTVFVHTNCTTNLIPYHYLNCTLIFFFQMQCLLLRLFQSLTDQEGTAVGLIFAHSLVFLMLSWLSLLFNMMTVPSPDSCPEKRWACLKYLFLCLKIFPVAASGQAEAWAQGMILD